MHTYQQQFIEFCIAHQALKWGKFTLKSGRISPYFFNLGVISTGHSLAQLGEYYATAIEQNQMSYDHLFGPAYKGIPLATATAMALHHQHHKDIPVSYDRKEKKDHGEGGQCFGAPVEGNVLIVDDVLTAGTAFRHAAHCIEQEGATIAGFIVALDRQEKGSGEKSALHDIACQWNIPAVSIITFKHIVSFLKQQAYDNDLIERMLAYHENYGAL